jgi:hypothetical protein
MTNQRVEGEPVAPLPACEHCAQPADNHPNHFCEEYTPEVAAPLPSTSSEDARIDGFIASGFGGSLEADNHDYAVWNAAWRAAMAEAQERIEGLEAAAADVLDAVITNPGYGDSCRNCGARIEEDDCCFARLRALLAPVETPTETTP